jgi:alkyl hydroperoxide reductase subunit AhpF
MMIASIPTSRDVNAFATEAQERASDMVKENPALSMLVVFGVGIGVGALIGEAVSMTRTRPSATMAERIGRQICDTLNIKF